MRLVRQAEFPLDYRVLLRQSIFASQPYEHGEVKHFLKQVKFGNLQMVGKMIQKDPLLVFQFDEMHQTGLIWAVKRNNIIMTRYLLKKFSQVNFRDLAGRTALNFAVSDKNLEMVKVLICFKADPSSEDAQK